MGISNGDDELALQLVEATCMTCQSAFKPRLGLFHSHVKEESRSKFIYFPSLPEEGNALNWHVYTDTWLLFFQC